MDTAEDTRFEKVEVRLCAFRTLEPNLLLDLHKFELHEFVVGVASTMQVGEDLKSLVWSVVVNEPTRAL